MKKLVLQKLMTGHYIDKVPEDNSKPVSFVMKGDGLWEIRKNKIGEFYTHVAKTDVFGLDNDFEEGWVLNVPRMPSAVLDTIIAFFRKVYSKHGSEVFLRCFYDTEEEKYILDCPKQEIGPASVRYEVDEKFEDPKYIFFFEIHSHGSMGAFFSGVDDADEKSDRFYGVIGKVSQKFPEIKLRLCLGKNKQDVDLEDIFDISDEEGSFPKEWLDNIKEAKKPKYVYYGGKHNGYKYKHNGGRSPISYMPHEHDPRNYWWNNDDNDDDANEKSAKSLQEGISDWLHSKNSELTADEMQELKAFFDEEGEGEDDCFDISDICASHHSNPTDTNIEKQSEIINQDDSENKDESNDEEHYKATRSLDWF